MDSKKAILIIAVVAVVIIAAIAVVYLNGNGNDKSQNMDSKVDSFVDSYDGVFGPFTKEDGATKDAATATKKNDSDRLAYSKITWTKSASAASDYKKVADGILAKTTLMGAKPIVLEVSGLDNVTAMKYDVTIGTMGTFSLFYFVTYVGDVVIQSYDSCLYKADQPASEDDMSAVLTAVAKTVGVKSVKVTIPADPVSDYVDSFVGSYTGVFGPFTKEEGATDDSATATKKNDSERLAYSKVSWKRAADAATQYEALSKTISSKGAMMGAQPVLLKISGFDAATAVKFDVVMGTMTKFTLLYFAAYVDDVLIQSVDNGLYKPNGLATVDDIKDILSAVGKTVGVDSVTVSDPKASEAAAKFAKNYSGAFGTYTATDNVASATVSKPRDMVFDVSADAKKAFDSLVASISTDPGSYTVVTVDSYDGLDGAYAFMKSRTMGSSNVSMLYIVAYEGDIVVDGATSYQYKNTGFATVDDINTMFAAIKAAISA